MVLKDTLVENDPTIASYTVSHTHFYVMISQPLTLWGLRRYVNIKHLICYC